LLIELERLSRELLAHIQQDQIVALESPENVRSLEAIGGVHLDPVTAQNVLSHLARGLFFVNEQNFLAVEG